MKEILREAQKILAITSLALMYSCEIKEDYVHEHTHKQEIRISKIQLDALIKRKDFNEAFSRIKPEKSNNSFNRTVMEEEYGFTIADVPVIVIENNNTTSFTLLITRGDANDNEFENLVIAIDSLDQTQAVVVKYKPAVPIQQVSLHNIIFKGEIELSPITYNSNQTQAKTRYECLTIATSRCNGIPYDCGGEVCGYSYSHTCGFNSDYTPPDNGGGGTTTTGPGVNLLTTINHQDSHTSKLNAMTNNSIVKPKMVDLKNRVNDTKEYGYEFTTHTNGTYIASVLLEGEEEGVQFPPVQVNTKVRIHVHHTAASQPNLALEPIPSLGDIIGFASMYNDKVNLGATDAQDITSIVMSNTINYAMRVTNPVKLQAFFDDYNDPNLVNTSAKTFGDAVDDLFKDISKQANKDCQGSCTDAEYDVLLEMYFMKTLKRLNCGISLYYALPTDTNYSWEIIN